MYANEGSTAQALYVYEATPGVDASTAILTHKSNILDDPAADRLIQDIRYRFRSSALCRLSGKHERLP